ncbi:transcription initiation factor TFIID subunit 4-like [Panicum virgatum]|uniref:transcription initiation factor TFIID subunit 4-like n=1 Tax=Panicum virgatum TaxID=38727 RepID=UPI0019D52A19|nr:transcription initiation factor TFIID subunit 4-like [Panicum virgatum]
MALLGPEILFRGFRLDPTPLEATTYYLPQLLAGAPMHEAIRPFIHHADVYACEPGELARLFRPLPKTGHRFFFTHCKLQQPHRAGKASKATRAAGAGSWHSQGVTDVVDLKEVKVGEMRKLRYKKGGAYTDWLMEEYSCSRAACRTPSWATGSSAARQESAAFFAPPAPAPAPAVIAQVPPQPLKRPAPQVAEPPCPKRTRGAVVALNPPVIVAGASSDLSCSAAEAHAGARTTAASCAAKAADLSRWRGSSVDSLGDRIIAGLSSASGATAPPPTRLSAPPRRTPAPAPPRPLGQPKQQMPPPIPLVVRSCHMPVQAPAHHCGPQPSAHTKNTRDPFEAAELRDEAEDDFDEDDLAKALDEAVPTAEAEEEAPANSTMADDEMEQHLLSLLGNDTVIVPKEEIPDAIAYEGILA